jgi:hopanoid biosynthesis associated radical SAM protein HpnH
MSVPVRQSLTVGRYLLRQKLRRNDKFPLLVELEPLFQCNLACSFCGKIQYPEHILKKRMPVEQALAAIEESGAPMVSIAGGEPLVHPEVHELAAELVRRKKFVYLCTNGILMKKKMDLFEPSPYFAWVVHLDGMRERHDEFVEREGTFDKAVDAIRGALPRRRPGAQALLDRVRGRAAQALAAEPHAALPRLPRREGRLPVHAVGHPELLALRLAAAVLPDVRRVHGDLP